MHPTPRNDIPDTPVAIPVEAYVSPAYARAEKALLWDKVWQIACREEEIPDVGDYVTYDVLENSAIVVRSAPGEVSAFRNACRHRGRRLTEGCGHADRFQCPYHAWQYGLDGACAHVSRRENWGGGLDGADMRLGPVRSGCWAGYVWVNFDPDCMPLQDYLGTMPAWIDPFRHEEMRYVWRKSCILQCNWKSILEAFIEIYHAPFIHPQNRNFSCSNGWARGEGLHSAIGTAGREGSGGLGMNVDPSVAKDHRKTVHYTVNLFKQTMGALTTDRQIAAADMLFDVLPETACGGGSGGEAVRTGARDGPRARRGVARCRSRTCPPDRVQLARLSQFADPAGARLRPRHPGAAQRLRSRTRASSRSPRSNGTRRATIRGWRMCSCPNSAKRNGGCCSSRISTTCPMSRRA